MSILADRCINPNCRELIKYEDGTQEIRCPWCDHAFLAREFEGEQKKVVEALMAGKQARDALSMERKEKEALQALLNKSQQAWIDYADVQKQVTEQLRKIQQNTTGIKADTVELLAGQKEIIREVKENRRVGLEDAQKLREDYQRGQQQDAEAQKKMRQELAEQRERQAAEMKKLQQELAALKKEVGKKQSVGQGAATDKREGKQQERAVRPTEGGRKQAPERNASEGNKAAVQSTALRQTPSNTGIQRGDNRKRRSLVHWQDVVFIGILAMAVVSIVLIWHGVKSNNDIMQLCGALALVLAIGIIGLGKCEDAGEGKSVVLTIMGVFVCVLLFVMSGYFVPSIPEGQAYWLMICLLLALSIGGTILLLIGCNKLARWLIS